MLPHANAEIQCFETANLLSGRYVNHRQSRDLYSDSGHVQH